MTAAIWHNELMRHPDTPTVVAIHQPPFETGIWWMDCVGLNGAELFEGVVRRHDQVLKVPVGPSAKRSPIEQNAPDLITWVRGVQTDRESLFK